MDMDINLDELDALEEQIDAPVKKPGRRNPLEKFTNEEEPAPKKKYKRIPDSFSFQENVINAFKKHCAEEGKNKSKIVENLVIEYLEKNKVNF